MLDSLSGPSSEDLVKRISALNSEPVEPTEELKAEEVETEVEAETDEAEEQESEQDQSDDTSSGDESETEEEEELYVHIDGEQVSLDKIREWKSNGLMQADYTRKTMSLADERKDVKGEREQLNELSKSMQDKIASLDTLISEDEKTVDWEDLRDHDPSEYLKRKEEFKAKRDALDEAKLRQLEVSKVQLAEESKKLVERMPTWADTKVRDQEIAAAMQFAAKLGFSDADLSAITDHRIYMSLIQAAKFDKLQESKVKVKKKVSKAPKVLKPSQKSKSKAPKTNVQEAKDRLKRSGSEKDAHAALKALFG